MISHNLTVNFVRPAIQEVLELLYLVLFEILIPKVRNVFIESPDIYIDSLNTML